MKTSQLIIPSLASLIILISMFLGLIVQPSYTGLAALPTARNAQSISLRGKFYLYSLTVFKNGKLRLNQQRTTSSEIAERIQRDEESGQWVEHRKLMRISMHPDAPVGVIRKAIETAQGEGLENFLFAVWMVER